MRVRASGTRQPNPTAEQAEISPKQSAALTDSAGDGAAAKPAEAKPQAESSAAGKYLCKRNCQARSGQKQSRELGSLVLSLVGRALNFSPHAVQKMTQGSRAMRAKIRE